LLLTADPAPNEIVHGILEGVARITKTSAGDGGDGGTSTKNNPPHADASASQTSGFVGESIDFDGSRSTDSDGTIDMYEWDWNDDGDYDTSTSFSSATHTFNAVDTYTVTLRVTDNDGSKDEDTVDVVIAIGNNPPAKPTVNGPTTGNKNTDYDYTAVSTDADDDTIQYTFDWDDSSANTVTDFLTNGTTTTQTHGWTTPGIYEISVKAYDNKTVSTASKITVLIDSYWVNDIGYFIDDDGDGTYDSFYSNITKELTDFEKQDDGTYLIDNDGDGDWDYIYDTETETLTEYSEPTTDYTLLIIVAIIVIMILIIVGYFLKKR